MPTYEYQCRDCGERFARLESIEDHAERPVPPCPKCRSSAVERVFSAFFAKTIRKS